MSLPGTFVETAAGRVFVHRAGHGEPLVLLHGFMMSHWYWRHLLPELSRTYEVIAVDLPGFGESDRPVPGRYRYDAPAMAANLVQVLDRLGLPRARVLGHSMGGGAALSLAARYPERVERLVLYSPAVFPLALNATAQLFMSPVGAFVFKHLFSKRELRRQMMREHFKDRRAVTDELVDYVWERLNRAGGREAAHAAACALGTLSASNAEPGRVRAPTLLLWPDYDRVFPLDTHGKRLHKAIAGARLHVIPDAGHNAHLERPDEFMRGLLGFLEDRTLQAAAETPVPAERAHAVSGVQPR